MNAFGLKDRRNTPLPPLGGLPGDPNIPSMNANPVSNVHGLLTPNSGGQHDVVSPGSSNSGVNSGSSQSGLSSITQYSHGSWPTPGGHQSNSFGFGSVSNTPGPLATSHQYDHKPSSFDSGSSMYTLARPSPSAGPGDSLSTPTYGQHQQQQHQFSSLYGHGGGSSATLPSHSSNHSTSPGGMLGAQNSANAQPPTPSSATAPHDPYSRPPSTQSYFSAASTPHQPSFPAYSPTAPSPTTTAGAPRGLHSLSGMAPPQAYRPYPSYQMHVPSMGGPIMSNLNNPGGQMSVMPGMAVSAYGHPLSHSIYGHAPPQPERPFKCDQCPQSFNRNHDLKRHKRIHLSVKPFPCGSCDKAFSRKDALKRHRLVKGCGDQMKDDNKDDNSNNESGRSDASASESPTMVKRE